MSAGLGSLGALVGGLGPTLCFIVCTHLLDHRGFDGRGCGLDELALLLERGEEFLAGYSELFC